MAMLGQASGAFTESSSTLRILHLGIRNSVGVLTEDSFTQSNPGIAAVTGTESSQLGDLANVLGVLSGSIAFTRPDEGSNYIGGPVSGTDGVQPLGFFINHANGNSFENTPGSASGKGPYVSGQGTYANRLFETQVLENDDGAQADPLTYACGDSLYSSRNGFLTNSPTAEDGSAVSNLATPDTNQTIAILKMPADAAQNEIVYDQRI